MLWSIRNRKSKYIDIYIYSGIAYSVNNIFQSFLHYHFKYWFLHFFSYYSLYNLEEMTAVIDDEWVWPNLIQIISVCVLCEILLEVRDIRDIRSIAFYDFYNLKLEKLENWANKTLLKHAAMTNMPPTWRINGKIKYLC